MTFNFTWDKGSERLDTAISSVTNKTRSSVAKAINSSLVLVNGKPAKKSGLKVNDGDVICAEFPEAVPLSTEAENIPLDIIYEDDDIVVVNKPQGMVTHPASGSPNGTLVNSLLYNVKNLSGINGVIRPGIVHRLDKDTSGVLVVAKNDEAHLSLSKQISTKKALRYYYALVEGVIKADDGIINKCIARSTKDRKLMTVSDTGRSAITLYKVIARFNKYTLVECELKTGRTHQIRVHMKSINHPVVGDVQYGKASALAPFGQLLHAHKLVLYHPKTNERMEFEAPINETFMQALKTLGFDGKLQIF